MVNAIQGSRRGKVNFKPNNCNAWFKATRNITKGFLVKGNDSMTCWFQASADLRFFFWDVTQRRLVVIYRRFGTKYLSIFMELSSPKFFSWTAWPWTRTVRFSIKVGDYKSKMFNIREKRRYHSLTYNNYVKTSPVFSHSVPRVCLSQWTSIIEVSGPLLQQIC